MFQLICPDTELPSRSLRRKLQRSEDRLVRMSDELGDGALEPLVGFEVRTALRLVKAGNADSKTRAMLFRPAAEPILLIHGEKVWSEAFNPIDALAMACSLVGRELSYRADRCFGNSATGDVEFEPPDRVPLWLPAIKAIIRDEAMDAAASAVVFARTIIAHPMSDGNGRLARALSHALLLRRRLRPVAPIALAPAFYAKRDVLSRAMIDLCRTGDWNTYYEAFAGALALGIAMAEPLHAKLRPHFPVG